MEYKLDIVNELWASNLYRVEMDLFSNSCVWYVKAVEDDTIDVYELKFQNLVSYDDFLEPSVSSFAQKIYDTDSMYYAEILDAEASKKNDLYFFSFCIWDESHTINIVCKKFSYNKVQEKRDHSEIL